MHSVRLTAAVPRVKEVGELWTVPCHIFCFEATTSKQQRKGDLLGFNREDWYLVNARGASHVYKPLLVSLVWFFFTSTMSTVSDT